MKQPSYGADRTAWRSPRFSSLTSLGQLFFKRTGFFIGKFLETGKFVQIRQGHSVDAPSETFCVDARLLASFQRKNEYEAQTPFANCSQMPAPF
jgi:hypothetical protein